MLKHQTCHTANRDMRAHAGFIDDDKGAVEHIKVAVFNVQDRQAILDGDGFEGWKQVGQDVIRFSSNRPRADAAPPAWLQY